MAPLNVFAGLASDYTTDRWVGLLSCLWSYLRDAFQRDAGQMRHRHPEFYSPPLFSSTVDPLVVLHFAAIP